MGRIWSPGKYVARPEWYDRNPIDRTLDYEAGGIAPHAKTSRGSYTVPGGKKAFLESLFLLQFRVTAATTVGATACIVEYTPSGGGTYIFNLIYMVNNTVNALLDRTLTNFGCLRAGDKIEIFTYDLSTGGTMTFYELIKITEFDA